MTFGEWDDLLNRWDSVAQTRGPRAGSRAGVLFGYRTEADWMVVLGQRKHSSRYEANDLIPWGVPCGSGSWCGPGGARNPGESLLECALRETLEEFLDVYPVPAHPLQMFCERLCDYLPPELYEQSLQHGYSRTFGFTAYFVPLKPRPADRFWSFHEFIRATSPRWFSRAEVLAGPRELPAGKWRDWPQPYFHLGLIEIIEDLHRKGAFQ
jgi:NUDIX domain-containing protein